jgi:trans-aconitate 2-methyltransferase
MREWTDADTYHRVSEPQLRWGLAVLDRLRLIGTERVLDVGCGTGRLTEHLAWRVRRGRVVGVDLSANMLNTAGAYLASVAAGHVSLVQADASALPFASTADAIVSTATFHWITDHERLFRNLLIALAPGGRLIAQCGGELNIRRLMERGERLIEEKAFAPHFSGWTRPWLFAGAAITAQRLARAGFVAVDTSEHYAPERFPSAETFRAFATNVVCRRYLERLPDTALRHRFMDAIVDQYSRDSTPFELDYWRLNLSARKPG